MTIDKGDRVLVNLAAFIGSPVRSEESVSCEVLGVRGGQIEVRAEPPYRPVSLLVNAAWVDRVVRTQAKRVASHA